jgi:uncharacterized protein (DUF302 family)
MDYGRTIELDLSYEEALPKVKEAFKEQGFGTLTEIDVRATLKEKIDRDFEPYIILGVCNPQLASQALDVDRQIGLLLPCNVVVTQRGDKTIVHALDPQVMVAVPELDELKPITDEAGVRIDRALEALKA